MASRFTEVRKVLGYVSANPDADLSLGALAARARLSPFHLHRLFSQLAGETPRHYTARLRLARAAVLLLTTRDSVIEVALASGFQSHETFCRAFRRHFGVTPREYRKRGFAQQVSASQAEEHAAFVRRFAPCLGLYHRTPQTESREDRMSYTVTKKELTPQPVLVVRRRVKRSEIAATIGAVLPQVFAYAAQHGIALSGLPFTRYTEISPGMVTMEPGMRIAALGGALPEPAADAGEVALDTLPGGPAVTTLHIGAYDSLTDAYAAIEQWIESQGLERAGAPWESYVNDPSEHPDTKDWKTEVFWPVRG